MCLRQPNNKTTKEAEQYMKQEAVWYVSSIEWRFPTWRFRDDEINSLILHKIDVIDIHIVWSEEVLMYLPLTNNNDMQLNEDCVIWLGIQILDCTFSQNYDDDYATMLFLPQTAGTLSKWSTLSKK